ncbi:MAG: anti-sigma factor family protein [Roseinatronobacter sp.]
MSVGISEEKLNAFVDGELSPAEAAQVAAMIADDARIAHRVLRLHQMKAALAGFADAVQLPPMPEDRARRPSLLRKAASLGAAAAFVIAVLIPIPTSGPGLPTLSDTSLALHDTWLALGNDAGLWSLPVGFEWIEPVMRTSRLELVYAREGEALQHLGFKGANACRLSLFVSVTDPSEKPLRLTLSDDRQHAIWQTGGFAFEMVARDMAPARFATVATGLREGSGRHGTVASLHLALSQSATLPCSA